MKKDQIVPNDYESIIRSEGLIYEFIANGEPIIRDKGHITVLFPLKTSSNNVATILIALNKLACDELNAVSIM